MQVISTVDYMVAAGNEHGVITVFQIPKSPPDTLPDSLKPKQKKRVKNYIFWIYIHTYIYIHTHGILFYKIIFLNILEKTNL